MTTITDEYMFDMLSKTKDYTMVLLKMGPKADHPDLKKIIWEHGRRNFGLRADGQLAIVAPVTAETGVAGLYIFNAGAEESKKIMEADPGVQEGVFIYEIHPIKSFPGDSLA